MTDSKTVVDIKDLKNGDKEHISICVSGHVDQGKSTLVGRLIYDLGGIDARAMEKLKNEAKAFGKESFEFAFYMDRNKESRARGITIDTRTEHFFTKTKHVTVVDTPGHRDYITNFLAGSSCADAMILLCSAKDEFAAALAKGTLQAHDQGQTRQHARFAYLQGIKQLVVVINKMDAVEYSQEKYKNVKDNVKHMLKEVGWSKDAIDNMPFVPVAAYLGDNLITETKKMSWWKGMTVANSKKEKILVKTLYDALDKYLCVPPRMTDKPLRIPISGIYQIQGIGFVATGKVEEGVIKPKDEIRFAVNGGEYSVFSIEQHHKKLDEAGPGDNIGLNIKLNKENLPKPGDVIVHKTDKILRPVKEFRCQVQTLDHPGELKVGYTPIACVRTAKIPAKMTKIIWRMGKETGNKKVDDAKIIKQNEMAELVFEPQKPMTLEAFKSCEGLGRIAFLDGNQATMLGRILDVVYEEPKTK
jgi:elongation factor 1-alpha